MSSLTITFVGGVGLLILVIIILLAFGIGKVVGQSKGFSDAYNSLLDIIEERQKHAMGQLWVSVDDFLPDYDDIVLVCNIERPFCMYQSKRTKSNVSKDSNDFITHLGISVTHWLKILPPKEAKKEE